MTGSYFHRTETALFWEESSTNFFLLTLPPSSAADWNSPYLPGTFTQIGNALLYLLAPNIFFFPCNWQHVSSHWRIHSVTLYPAYLTLYLPIFSPLPEMTTSKEHPFSRRVPQFFPLLSADQGKCAQLRKNACNHNTFHLRAIMDLPLKSVCARGHFLLAAMGSSWDAALTSLGQKYLVLISFHKQRFNKSPLQNCH